MVTPMLPWRPAVSVGMLVIALLVPATGHAEGIIDEAALISYLKGVLAESQGDLSSAYQYYLYASARDPENMRLGLKLGSIALELGDIERAKEYGEKLRGSKGYEGAGGMILAEAEYMLGNEDEALKLLTELRARSDVPRERVLKFLAKIYLDRKEPDRARAALEEASTLPGADLVVFYELGILHAEAGENERAIEALEKAVAVNRDFSDAHLALARLLVLEQRREEAKRSFREVLRLDPQNRDALKDLTDMLYEDGEYSEGAAVLEPLHREGTLDEGGEIIYGRFLYRAGALDQALAVFDNLMKKAGEKPALLRVISEIEVEQGNLKSALNHLKRLIEIEPDRFANYVGLLLISYGLTSSPSSPAEAVSIAEGDKQRYLEESAKRVNGESEDENYIMGSVLRKAGQLDRAEQYLVRAEQLNPKKSSTLLELATLYGHTGRYDEALKRVIFLYNRDPDDASLANFYGYLLAEKGDSLDVAEKLLNKALAKEPGNGYFLDSFAWIRFKMGRYEEALKIFLEALKKAKDDAVIWEHLGDTYVKLNDPRKAAAAYKKSLSLDPGSKTAAEKMEKLKTGDKRNE